MNYSLENESNEPEEWEDDDDLTEESEETGEEQKTVQLHLKLGARQEPMRIDKYLMNRIEGATRTKIQQAIEKGWILINGNTIKSNYKIKPFDDILVYDHRETIPTDIIPEEMPLDIVYEDADLMVINKQPGIVVHPGSGNYSGTLVNGIAWYLNPESDKNRIIDLPRVGLVHRIDKDTSGLLLIAKTEQSMSQLAKQFKEHSVHRRYIALAWGNIEEDQGTIEAHIGRNIRFRKKMDAFPDGDHGKPAITHFRVLERFHYVSLLEFRLETGRTHQIRVHSRLIGHPLFNDSTYGGDRIVKGTVHAKYKQFVENNFKLLPRQALHAKELGFLHPGTGQQMMFDSDLPEDLTKVINRWRNYISGKGEGDE